MPDRSYKHEGHVMSSEQHQRSAPLSPQPRRTVRYWTRCLLCAVLASGSLLGTAAIAAPKVVLISLDGATPGNIERFLDDGTLSKKRGLGLLIKRGVTAKRNVTVTPSLTAPAHIAIATGSAAAKNDILANSFHLLAIPFARNISGFGGDVFALLNVGYNFDGTQSPVILRLSDPSVTAPVFSVPNFYGAHGYNPKRRGMSAIFIASGPDIRMGSIERARNIDIAPTVLKLLGVPASDKIEGECSPCCAEAPCLGL